MGEEEGDRCCEDGEHVDGCWIDNLSMEVNAARIDVLRRCE